MSRYHCIYCSRCFSSFAGIQRHTQRMHGSMEDARRVAAQAEVAKTVAQRSVKAAVWMEQEKLGCEACGRPVWAGQSVRVDEKSGFYMNVNRFRIWHRECHPDVVQRNFEKICRQVRETGTFL